MFLKVLPYACLRAFPVLGILFLNLVVNGQDPTHVGKFDFIDNNINGFYEYLPRDYWTETNRKYPLLIFIHGSGETGTTPDQATLSKLLANGVPKLIAEDRFPETIASGGVGYRFIVLSPQIKNGLQVEGTVGTSIIQPSTIDAVIEYAKATYAGRIDESRIYLAGLSMGGGAIWDYAGSSLAAAGKIAAAIVAAGAGDLSDAEAENIASSRLPILATHNTVDNIVLVERTRANIAKINSYSPAITPAPKAFYFTNPGAETDGAHNVWTRTLEVLTPGSTSGGNVVDSLGMTAYQWLLQYSRIQVSTPVTWEQVSAKLSNGKVNVEWTVSMEQHLKNYEVEKSNDASNWSRIATIQPQTGGASRKKYSYLDDQPLSPLTYYRIKQTDFDGKFTYSAVQVVDAGKVNSQIRIYPNPFVDKIDLHLNGISGKKIDIAVLSASGTVLRKESRQGSLNGTTISLNGLQSLTPGIYYVIAKDEQGTVLYSGRVWRSQ